jgi:hypothetical protein
MLLCEPRSMRVCTGKYGIKTTLRDLEKSEYILLVAFFALLTLPVLYIFRYLDNNSLTSWKWAFADVGVVKVFLYLFAGIFVSFFLSKTSYPERYPYLFLFFFSFAVTLPLWKEPELILDVSRYFLQAKHLELYGFKYFFREWGREIEPWTDLPLLPLLYGSVFKYFGEVRVFIQFLNTLFFSLHSGAYLFYRKIALEYRGRILRRASFGGYSVSFNAGSPHACGCPDYVFFNPFYILFSQVN